MKQSAFLLYSDSRVFFFNSLEVLATTLFQHRRAKQTVPSPSERLFLSQVLVCAGQTWWGPHTCRGGAHRSSFPFCIFVSGYSRCGVQRGVRVSSSSLSLNHLHLVDSQLALYISMSEPQCTGNDHHFSQGETSHSLSALLNRCCSADLPTVLVWLDTTAFLIAGSCDQTRPLPSISC